MSISNFFINTAIAGGMAVSLTTAFSLEPTNTPVEITSPQYIVSEMNLGYKNQCTSGCLAQVLTKDEKYAINVEFDYSAHANSDDFETWVEPEIDSLTILSVETHEDEVEVQAYIDRSEISLINEALAKEIYEVRS